MNQGSTTYHCPELWSCYPLSNGAGKADKPVISGRACGFAPHETLDSSPKLTR